MELFEYKAPALFSVQKLTITGNPESWPVDTFAVFVAKVLSTFQHVDRCQAYTGTALQDPIEIHVSATTEPLFKIFKMQLTLPKPLLIPFSKSVTGIITKTATESY